MFCKLKHYVQHPPAITIFFLICWYIDTHAQHSARVEHLLVGGGAGFMMHLQHVGEMKI